MAWLGRALKSYRIPLDPHYRPTSKPIKKTEDGFIIYPRALEITWGNDRRYWNWKLPSPNMKDEESFAELKQVCWLEVTGSTADNLEIGKSYKVGFNVSLRPDAFGWDECKVYIMAKIGKKGEFFYKTFSFKEMNLNNEKPSDEGFDIPQDQLEIEVGSTYQSSDDLKLYFGMYEVWSKRWKGGLMIHHAFVRECKPQKK